MTTTTAEPTTTREIAQPADPAARRYPRTIDNGAGERLTFLRRIPSPAGDRVEVESVVLPGGGPPMHVHHYADEALTVVSGRMAFERPGEAPQFAGPGETAVFAAGEPHRFWNPGDDELHLSGHIAPADNFEWFLTEMYASQRRTGTDRPDVFEAAFLATRYRSEMGMLDIPAPVQRIVFPVLVLVGRALGRLRRYDGAPEPVRR